MSGRLRETCSSRTVGLGSRSYVVAPRVSERSSMPSANEMEATADRYLTRLHDVPGFLTPLDAALIVELGRAQADIGVEGDILEIGTWHGRSTILLGCLVREGETLHACDLFHHTPPTEAGKKELAASSKKMATRRDFSSRFHSFHGWVPEIHEVPSSALSPEALGRARFRFIHIDGSHTYETVTGDISLARELAAPGAIVVFDDYANVGYVGVAAALWPALERGAFEPFACSPAKLYATVGGVHARAYRATVRSFASSRGQRWLMNDVPDGSIVTVWPRDVRASIPARALRRAARMFRRLRDHAHRGRAPVLTGTLPVLASWPVPT